MFNINDDFIKSNTSSLSYDRGKEFHFANRIKSVQYNPKKNHFSAVVFDVKDRLVKLELDDLGNPVREECSCRPSGADYGICEHIAAVLFLIVEQDKQGFFEDIKSKETAKQFFDLFTSSGLLEKEPVRLIPTLCIEKKSFGEKKSSLALYFKTGIDDYYVIRDLWGFCRNMFSSCEAPVIKKFTFKPSQHRICDEDVPILNFLHEIYESNCLYVGEPDTGDTQDGFIWDGDRIDGNEIIAYRDNGDITTRGAYRDNGDMTTRGAYRDNSGMIVRGAYRDNSGMSVRGAYRDNGDMRVRGANHDNDDMIARSAYRNNGGMIVRGAAAQSGVFYNKMLKLTDTQLRRFLGAYKENLQVLQLEIPNVYSGAIRVNGDDLAFDFKLSIDGKDFLLAINAAGELIPLTKAKDLVYYANNIYQLSNKRFAELEPYINILEKSKENVFRFVSDDREKFVSEVLPYLEAAGTLTIDNDVALLIDKNDCVVEIYLDKEDDAIIADVKFVYGQTEINPFAPAKKNTVRDDSRPILARDIRKEHEILDILAETDFKVKNNRINLYDDDSVFSFIMEILPRLRKFANVFYSDDFMSGTVRRTMKYGLGFKINEKSNLLDIEFDFGDITPEEVVKILADIREKKRYRKLSNGVMLNLDDGQIIKLVSIVTLLGLTDEDIRRGRAQTPAFRALYIDEFLSETTTGGISRDRAYWEFIRNIRNPADMEFEMPGNIKAQLREYQKTGFRWVKTLSTYSLGGVLADDMGLGKTLQMLTVLMYEKENRTASKEPSIDDNELRASLIVAPTSIVYNWCEEIEKFAPTLKYQVITGTKRNREAKIKRVGSFDVSITSYPLIRMDWELYSDTTFSYCILDEAQHIKNPDSLNAQSVKRIKSKHRFALTGTPIENNLTELWSIFDFVLPGYLYTRSEFSSKYMRRLSFEQPPVQSSLGSAAQSSGQLAAQSSGQLAVQSSVQSSALSSAQPTVQSSAPSATQPPVQSSVQYYESGGQFLAAEERMEALKEIGGLTRPFLLRRLKTDVLEELPEKIEMKMPVEMTTKQRKIYLAHLAIVRKDLFNNAEDGSVIHNQMDILAALMRLRQICCHPSLFIENYDGDSGKFLLLQEVIHQALDGGHRALIFSQFVSMLAIIKSWLDSENIRYFYLDGQTEPMERIKRIRRFNEGEHELFLLSLKAGGAGINLTGADTVIHYDPWWNPAVEDQATDRAHRIGQKKTVQVIKMVTTGSIEEKIFELQNKKKRLIDDIIKPGETFLSKITIGELKELMNIK